MKILVVHHSFNSCGGGERLALHLIKVLQELGHDVYVGTTEKTDWNYVQRVIGIKLNKVPKEFYISPVRLRAFGIYQRLLTSIHVARFRRKFDLVINTHGDVMITPCDIVYLHFPVLAYFKIGYLKPYLKYMKSLFWYTYFQPYYIIQKKIAKKYFSNALILTNSRFSAYFIKDLFNKDAFVVYPPVEIDDYLKLSENIDREDAVIYIARYSPEKNNHLMIYLAKELPEYKFYLIGSAHGKGIEYYQYCKKLKERLNVKNIEIHANVPHSEKLKLLSKCKVYIHLFPTEHFGIAPVEALASGLIPVVPINSGTWTDVCEFGKYGIGYRTLNVKELSEKIQEAFTKWSIGFVTNAKKHIEKFNVREFREKIMQIMKIVSQYH